MKEILIINLTRMGDLIQTTPAIVALKERYPESYITLLASTHFIEICNSIPLVDRCIDLDEIYIAKATKSNRLMEGYRYLKSVLELINDRYYDLVINFTNSTASAILTSMINARERRGICIDKRGFIVKFHPWIRYIFNIIPSRSVNPFHLCDLHVKASGGVLNNKGLHIVVDEKSSKWVDDFFRRYGLDEDELIVALQLGASVEDKRWPVESFAKLADKLSDELNATILLTGSKSETKLGEEFEIKSSARTINMIGKTSLTHLSALLKRADLLVSNDTGTLHLATAVGTKVMDISLASVHFRETGPYGEGHYVVTSTLPCYPCHFESGCTSTKCKETITPDAVFQLCKAILMQDLEIMDTKHFENLQIYCPVFDKDGLICYLPLLKKKIDINELFIYIYKYTWQVVLDRRPFEEVDTILALIEEKMVFYEENPENYDKLLEYAQGFKRLTELIDVMLSVMGVMHRHTINEHIDINLIERLWENIEPVDQEIERLAYVVPYIKPIYIMLKYEKEAFKGENLKAVIEEAIRAYKYAKWQADVIYKILKEFVANRRLNLTQV